MRRSSIMAKKRRCGSVQPAMSRQASLIMSAADLRFCRAVWAVRSNGIVVSSGSLTGLTPPAWGWSGPLVHLPVLKHFLPKYPGFSSVGSWVGVWSSFIGVSFSSDTHKIPIGYPLVNPLGIV